MNIDEIQKKIDETDYWDMKIIGMNISFFGYVVELIIENDEVSNWKISFISCYKVSYVTDANRRSISKVSEMKGGQLGYYGQDITVFDCDNSEFLKVTIDLSIMDIEIECKEITVGKIVLD
jgi:hypothetical protein